MRKLNAAIVLAVLCCSGPAISAALSFKSRYAKVDFSWSKEAAAIPQLNQRFRRDFAREKTETVAGGREDFRTRGQGWESVTKVTTSGQSRRLLSLAREDWEYIGGAHGNGGTRALLWDRIAKRETTLVSLFTSTGAFERLSRQEYCRRLDQERAKRRGGEAKLNGPIPEFDACPAIADLALMPVDTNRNGRFDRISMVASAYLAGSYVEGEYDIAVPVTRALLAALKPEYRASFEAQRQ